MSSTREAYGAALTELAEKYEFFVLMQIYPRQPRQYILRKNILTGLQIWVLLNVI